MKHLLVCVFVLTAAPVAEAASHMARFTGVTDSHTIVVERDGAAEVVQLVNVFVAPEDELAACAFLRSRLTGAWLYVENGNVYRSPDALFINRELAYRAWAAPQLEMHVLGEINPGPHPRPQAPITVTAPAAPVVRVRAAPRRSSRRR